VYDCVCVREREEKECVYVGERECKVIEGVCVRERERERERERSGGLE
jgi:hypothetical protein